MPLNSPKLANFRVNSSLVAPALWKYDEQIQVWNLSEDDIQKRDHKNDLFQTECLNPKTEGCSSHKQSIPWCNLQCGMCPPLETPP